MNNPVFVVGAGPGGIEHLTWETKNLIVSADVLLYDGLIQSEVILLSYYKNIKICTAKMKQYEIYEKILFYYQKKKKVVRLKIGSPSLFAHTSEDIDFFIENHIPYKILPAVDSALSSSLDFRIPQTIRGEIASVAISTGHREKPSLPIPVLDADSLVYLMGMKNLQKIVDKVAQKKKSYDIPVFIFEKTFSQQHRCIQGTLKTIVSDVKRYKIKPPAVIMISKGLEKYKNNRKTILFTGLTPDRFVSNESVYHLPLIEIHPLKNYQSWFSIMRHLDLFDGIVFTSQNAVKYFYILCTSMKIDFKLFSKIAFFCIGTVTNQMFYQFFNMNSNLISENPNKESLTQNMIEYCQNNKIKKILYPSSSLANVYIVNQLKEKNIQLIKKNIYKTILRKIDFPVDFSSIKEIYFTSSSTVKSFIMNFQAIPDNVKLFVIGQNTKKVLLKYTKKEENIYVVS